MRTISAAVACTLALSGCASWSTYNKERQFDDKSTAIFIDAKQRAILSNVDLETGHRRFCAEPSPDALSAFSAKMGLDLSLPTKGDLGYNQAFSEGAASIGLRTQSIQLLRDMMFTNCEAFLNKGISDFGLETLQRRFQNTLVAVLAIEQLTGAIKAPNVALGGQATGNDAQLLSDTIKLVDSAAAALKSSQATQETAEAAARVAKQELDDFKKTHPADTASSEYKAAKEKSDKADVTAKTAKEATLARQIDLGDAKSLRVAAGTAGGGTSVNALFLADQPNRTINADTAKEIGSAVSGIVEKTLSLGFGREVCVTLFDLSLTKESKETKANAIELSQRNTSLMSECLNYLRQDASLLAASIERIKNEDARARAALDMVEQILTHVAQKKMSADDGVKLIAAINHSSSSGAPQLTSNTSAEAVKVKFDLNALPFLSQRSVLMNIPPAKKQPPITAGRD